MKLYDYMANDILDNPQLPSDHFIITGPSRFELTPMQKVINLGGRGRFRIYLEPYDKNWLRNVVREKKRDYVGKIPKLRGGV